MFYRKQFEAVQSCNYVFSDNKEKMMYIVASAGLGGFLFVLQQSFFLGINCSVQSWLKPFVYHKCHKIFKLLNF